MSAMKVQSKIRHILCPTDLSAKSQKALGFATRLAETLNAELTACYCSPPSWLSSGKPLPEDEAARLDLAIRKQIQSCLDAGSLLRWHSRVIENSSNPARDILELAETADADLIVMKARPSVLSALRYGSIVERVITGTTKPVMLFPSRFLADRDPSVDSLEFSKILFDYDFTYVTGDLFHVANALTLDYEADLHVLSVLEPPRHETAEISTAMGSRGMLQTATREKLQNAVRSEGRSVIDVPTVVEWGRHAETILRYADIHDIDLICATLARPNFYFEKLYSAYLGDLLKSAKCPILVKQSV